MGSKAIVLVGLSLAIVLLICSEVAARDLVEQTSAVSNDKTEAVKETNGVKEAKYVEYGGGDFSFGSGKPPICSAPTYGKCIGVKSPPAKPPICTAPTYGECIGRGNTPPGKRRPPVGDEDAEAQTQVKPQN